MLVPFLIVSLCVSMRVSSAAIAPVKDDVSTFPPPQVFSPVILSQLCQDNTNYCIYIDQVRPGFVQASPVNATDNQGAFLFERHLYEKYPFQVCFGGCCIELDFAFKEGCVVMRYVERPTGEPGHLLARFADNVELIIGPKDYMEKKLMACQNEDTPLPYAVIGPRSGRKVKPEVELKPIAANPNDPVDSTSPSVPVNPKTPAVPAAAAVPVAKDDKGAGVGGGKDAGRKGGKKKEGGLGTQPLTIPASDGRDYFDDVTVPIVDA